MKPRKKPVRERTREKQGQTLHRSEAFTNKKRRKYNHNLYQSRHKQINTRKRNRKYNFAEFYVKIENGYTRE